MEIDYYFLIESSVRGGVSGANKSLVLGGAPGVCGLDIRQETWKDDG